MTLAERIALHRGMYRDELKIPRLTVAHVPADTETIPIGDGMVEVTDSGELGGMPFSQPFVRRLGPPSGYGASYPWAHSWSYLRRACRNDHPGHMEREVFGGALCWQAVSYCVVSEFDPPTIAPLLSDPSDDFVMPVESVERHLLNGFRWIEEDMDRKQRIRNARDPQPSEEPTPTRISLLQCDAANRAVENFDLEQRIWNSQREIMARHGKELPTWEDEWRRRQDALFDHKQECDRCRRAA